MENLKETAHTKTTNVDKHAYTAHISRPLICICDFISAQSLVADLAIDKVAVIELGHYIAHSALLLTVLTIRLTVYYHYLQNRTYAYIYHDLKY